MRKWILLLVLPLMLGSAPTRTDTYVSGATIDPAEVTRNEDAIFGYLQAGVDTLAANSVVSSNITDGTITNADISSGAAIVDTKLAAISTTGAVSTSALDTATGAIGDMLIYDGTNYTNQPIGTNGKSLMVVSGGIRWRTLNLAEDVTGTLPAANGGTGAIRGGWVQFDAAGGTPTIADSYNVSSITDNNVGDYSVVWDTDFSDTTYSFTFGGGTHNFWGVSSQSGALLRLTLLDTDGATPVDEDNVSVIAFGN